MPLSQSMQFIITAYIIKIIADLVITFPSTLLQYCLKRLEDYNPYDIGVKYNPFALREPKNTV